LLIFNIPINSLTYFASNFDDKLMVHVSPEHFPTQPTLRPVTDPMLLIFCLFASSFAASQVSRSDHLHYSAFRPPHPMGPSIPLRLTYALPSFDIHGVNGTTTGSTSRNGYTAFLRFNHLICLVIKDSPANIFNVLLFVSSALLSHNTGLFPFTLENRNSDSRQVDVCVQCGIDFNGNNFVTIWGLPSSAASSSIP
jgi:hypothetical protein